MNGGELRERQVPEGRSEEVIDYLTIPLVRFGSDFRLHRGEPARKPISNRYAVRVDVLASIKRPQ
jgi:hypothetical protein